jgi:serine/threonine protein phosphatase PrpC
MSWQFAQVLNIGKRSEQQDRVGIFHNNRGTQHLLVVADGMGGIPRGDLAAQLVVDTAEKAFAQENVGNPESFLEEICFEAHDKINRLEADIDSAPGTTCVLLYIDKDRACWAHIGDSRLYHFRQQQLVNQTQDHSVRELMIKEGLIAADSEAASAVQNQLYKRLGGSKYPEPDVHSGGLEVGDLFVLCSDGLWQSVEAQSIPEILQQHPLDQDGLQGLVDIAVQNGGDNCDNIGVALARWDSSPSGILQSVRSFFRGG